MGLFASYDLCLPKPLLQFLWLLNRMSYIFSLFLGFLRLHPPPPSQAIRIHPSSHTTDQHLSSPAPAPPPIVPTLIKSLLPVIEFANLAGDSPSTTTACVICLGGLEPGDEVLELGNCRHAFHKACINNWIDMDGISCPLCRLPLLPLKEEEKNGVLVKFFTRISWTLQIN